MNDLLKLIHERKSTRTAFDPGRKISRESLTQILEAARWSPTPHNMQNFEIIVVDDKKTLRKIGGIRSGISEVFLRENYKQFSFSKEELLRKRVGVLQTMFPESWRDPTKMKTAAREIGSPMNQMIDGSPMLLVVLYDPRKRAPASKNDALGFMGLGCVMENMWLMAQSLGIGYQILSTLSNGPTEKRVKSMLKVPGYLRIGFTVRLGHPVSKGAGYLRVRREIGMFVHHNRFGNRKL